MACAPPPGPWTAGCLAPEAGVRRTVPAQIQKADPRARMTAVVLILVIGVAGAALISATNTYLAGLAALAEMQPEAAIARGAFVFKLVALAGGLGLMLLAAYVAHLAARVRRSERFPPPGVRVVRDTRILEGYRAKRRGDIGLLLAVVVAACGIVLPVLIWRLINGLTP